MEKQKLLYEGKAKQIYSTDVVDKIIVHYKDDTTAGNGAKFQQFENKGKLNAAISTMIFKYLINAGIPTHFIKQVNELDVLCEKVTIFPLEVIIRNIATGSLTQRLGIAEGTKLEPAIPEICYKNDAFADPLINDYHAIVLGLATTEELAEIYQLLFKINTLLQELFTSIGITLVDFKIEFGKTAQGELVLADEISPDTCRFWDMETQKKMDKDRFRQDLGNVMGAYQEIYTRLEEHFTKGEK
jgi:phosphoribosylaminoimidazole-succinocarboxamide synthase